MKISSIIKLLIFALILTGCKTVGGEFCINSGHDKKSVGYKQCVASYQANLEFYKYCQSKKGIVVEGAQLNQCLTEAKSLKSQMQQDQGFCQQEANTKFAAAFSKPKQEKQPTLTENGDLVVGNIVLNSTYSSAEKNNITAPFVNKCVSAHGWYNPGIWQGGKRNVSTQEITSTVSQINKQPVSINIPEHNSVKLFTAAAEGNLYLLENAINSGSANASTTNHQGFTALHVASRRGQFQIIQALLERFAANPDALSHKGESAISLASYGKHHAIVNYITEFKIEKEKQRIAIEQQNAFSRINCRTGTQTTTIDGKTQRIPVTMCKQPDGLWKVAPPIATPSLPKTKEKKYKSKNEKHIDEAVNMLMKKWLK